ncbi:MAG: sulfotransferase [Patescibacteria group bacterium]
MKQQNKYKKIIVVAGVPRSGTSWLSQIIDSSPQVRMRFQPLFSYAFKDAVNEDSSKKEYNNFFNGIYKSNDDFLLQSDKRKSGIYPTFSKDKNQNILAFKAVRYHYLLEPMLRKFKHLKVVGIIRHPCAVMNSWINNPSEFPAGCNSLNEWRHGMCKNSGPEDFFGYYKWKEVANMYLDLKDKYPKRVYILKYEDLVLKTEKNNKDLFSFMGLPLKKQTLDFIQESTKKHIDNPYSVYKNKSVIDKWKKQLNPKIIKEIYADLEKTRLEKYLKCT